MLTWGQIAALAIALANFLDSVWKFFTISYMHWHPWENFTEKVVFWPLIQQFATYWLWVILWFSYTFIGSDPIHIANPIVVNNTSAKEQGNVQGYGTFAYVIVHMLLFAFVIVH